MTGKDNSPSDAAELRRKAEAIALENAAQSPDVPERLTPEMLRQTIHELRVHQIELEMQNEELRRAQIELDVVRARYFDLYDLAPVGYVTLSDKGIIREANLTAATLLGVTRGVLVTQPFSRFILPADQDVFYRHFKKLLETGETQSCELWMVKLDGTVFWTRLESIADPVCRITMSDITDRKRVEEELQKAMDDIRTLRGILPICMICKKIRDDQGYWNQVEVYVRDRTEAEFSHGICPECATELYPQFTNGGDEDTR